MVSLRNDADAGVVTMTAVAAGAPVAVEVHGEGPPVVIVGAAVPRVWGDPLTRALRPDHAVVNFDYEPYEGWDGQTEGRTCVQMAADTLEVMDHIGLARAHVVGLSRGAVAAYALAARHPDRVLSVSLLVPVAPYPDLFLDPSPPASASDLSPPDDEADMPRFFASLAFSEAWLDDHLDEALALIGSEPGSVERVPREQEEAIGRDEVPQRPTLIVRATEDRTLDPAHAQALRDAVPEARWLELPGAHGALMEQPRPWADALRTFIAEVNASA